MTNYFEHLEAFPMMMNGEIYSLSFTDDLTGSETIYLQIKTGAKSCLVLNWSLASTLQPVKVTTIESPTITNGTTAVASYNFNRQKTATATTLFYSDPTSISAGTVIHIDTAGASKHAGGSSLDAELLLLKKNTSYVWKVEQLNNQATTIVGSIVFAEDFKSAP
jgi:hypothetical protein